MGFAAVGRVANATMQLGWSAGAGCLVLLRGPVGPCQRPPPPARAAPGVRVAEGRGHHLGPRRHRLLEVLKPCGIRRVARRAEQSGAKGPDRARKRRRPSGWAPLAADARPGVAAAECGSFGATGSLPSISRAGKAPLAAQGGRVRAQGRATPHGLCRVSGARCDAPVIPARSSPHDAGASGLELLHTTQPPLQAPAGLELKCTHHKLAARRTLGRLPRQPRVPARCEAAHGCEGCCW